MDEAACLFADKLMDKGWLMVLSRSTEGYSLYWTFHTWEAGQGEGYVGACDTVEGAILESVAMLVRNGLISFGGRDD